MTEPTQNYLYSELYVVPDGTNNRFVITNTAVDSKLPLTLTEQADPATAPSGQTYVYVNTSGILTSKDDTGAVTTYAGGTAEPSDNNFQGSWAASTNTPTLANGSGTAGDFYVSSDAGSVDFGAGSISFVLGDRVVYDGAIWSKILLANISDVSVTYIADWNATTAFPGGTSAVGKQGFYYLVTVEGTTSVNSIVVWNVGDWVISDGTNWTKQSSLGGLQVNGLFSLELPTTTNPILGLNATSAVASNVVTVDGDTPNMDVITLVSSGAQTQASTLQTTFSVNPDLQVTLAERQSTRVLKFSAALFANCTANVTYPASSSWAICVRIFSKNITGGNVIWYQGQLIVITDATDITTFTKVEEKGNKNKITVAPAAGTSRTLELSWDSSTGGGTTADSTVVYRYMSTEDIATEPTFHV